MAQRTLFTVTLVTALVLGLLPNAVAQDAAAPCQTVSTGDPQGDIPSSYDIVGVSGTIDCDGGWLDVTVTTSGDYDVHSGMGSVHVLLDIDGDQTNNCGGADIRLYVLPEIEGQQEAMAAASTVTRLNTDGDVRSRCAFDKSGESWTEGADPVRWSRPSGSVLTIGINLSLLGYPGAIGLQGYAAKIHPDEVDLAPDNGFAGPADTSGVTQQDPPGGGNGAGDAPPTSPGILVGQPIPGSRFDAFDGDPATTDRLGAEGPAAAGIAASQVRFDDGEAVHAVLGRADDFADSLAATVLTGYGPLLLTPTTGLDPAVGDELQRVLPPGATVYLAGGEAALSTAVHDDVVALGFTPNRLAGPDRIGTSIAVAEEAFRLFNVTGEIIVARSTGTGSAAWADSVAAGPYAAIAQTPVLLTPTSRVDDRVADFLARWQIQRTYVMGGTAAISDAAETNLPGPVRVAGSGRAATAAESVSVMWARLLDGNRARTYFVINGYDEDGWIYGLTYAHVAGQVIAPMLMVSDSRVDAPTLTLLTTPCGEGPVLETVLSGPTALLGEGLADDIESVDGQPC